MFSFSKRRFTLFHKDEEEEEEDKKEKEDFLVFPLLTMNKTKGWFCVSMSVRSISRPSMFATDGELVGESKAVH